MDDLAGIEECLYHPWQSTRGLEVHSTCDSNTASMTLMLTCDPTDTATLDSQPELGFVGTYDLSFLGVTKIFGNVEPVSREGSRRGKNRKASAAGEGELETTMQKVAQKCDWQSSSIKASTSLKSRRLFALGICGAHFAANDIEAVVRRQVFPVIRPGERRL